MGGAVAVTIRHKDGEENRMCLWTNVMPEFINNIRILRYNKKYINDFVYNQWQCDVDKKEENKKNKKKAKISYYLKHPYLAPYDYGLIVLDYVTKNILTMQNYTTFGWEGGVFLVSKHYHERYQAFEEFLNRDKVIAVQRIQDGTDNVFEYVQLTSEQVLDTLKEEKATYYAYQYDFRPFTITNYQLDLPGRTLDRCVIINRFCCHLMDLGFKLSRKEFNIWKEYRQMYEQEEIL